MMQRWWMHFPLCPWGWRQGVAPATALHIAGTWRGNPPFVIVALTHCGRCHCDCRHHLRCRCRLRRHCRCHFPLPLPSAIAIAVAIDHCCCCLCCVAVSHCRPRCPHRQPLLSPSPSAIAVAISVSHHRCCPRQPFLRVVALARQELYSTNWSKECLPYFILFRQWAAYWSKSDDWPGVRWWWPTPALGGDWRESSS